MMQLFQTLVRWFQSGESSNEIEIPPQFVLLANHLAIENWFEADSETERIMREIIGAESREFTEQDFAAFPSGALKVIDYLWLKYSKGRFGFSVQKQIWQRYGSPKVAGSQWESFGDTVGWRVEGGWMRSYGNIDPTTHTNLTYTNQASQGHLPILTTYSERGLYEMYYADGNYPLGYNGSGFFILWSDYPSIYATLLSRVDF